MTREKWNLIGGYAHAANIGALWGIMAVIGLVLILRNVFGCP